MARTRILRPYHFIDKNPVIDIISTAIQDEGLSKKLDIVADLASLSRTTPKSWIHGDVRDPRHSSIMAVMLGLGWENTWAKSRKLNLEKELEFARAWNKKERAKRKQSKKVAGFTVTHHSKRKTKKRALKRA